MEMKYFTMLKNGELTRPKAKVIGQDGNIFNVMGIVSEALEDYADTLDGEKQEAVKEASLNIFGDVDDNAKSYTEALAICHKYARLV